MINNLKNLKAACTVGKLSAKFRKSLNTPNRSSTNTSGELYPRVPSPAFNVFCNLCGSLECTYTNAVEPRLLSSTARPCAMCGVWRLCRLTYLQILVKPGRSFSSKSSSTTPCSKHLLRFSSEWKLSGATCGRPQRPAASTSCSYLIHRAVCVHAASSSSPRSSSSWTNTWGRKPVNVGQHSRLDLTNKSNWREIWD